MKKISFIITFLFCALISFAYEVNDTFPNNQSTSNALTIFHYKGGLKADVGFINTNYLDTASASLTPLSDYSGAIIFVNDTMWVRDITKTHWIPIQSGGIVLNDTIYTRLPIFVDTVSMPGKRILTLLHANGLFSGGIVTLDSCMTLDVTTAIYYLNYLQYTTAQVLGLVVQPADVFDRTDAVIVDSFGVVSILKGLAGNISPYINPSSQVLLATISVPANVTCLTVTQEIIYDGIGDFAGQWTTATSGTITTNFINTDNPFHLLQDLFISTYTDSSTITFTKPSGTDTVKSTSVLKVPIYLIGAMTNQIKGQWFNGSTAVSNIIVLNPYFNINDSNEYQLMVVPMQQAWNFSNPEYNKLVFTFAGNDISGAKGLYKDYIQIQTGINNVATQLQLTTIGTSGAATLIGNVLNIPIYSGGGTISDTTFEWSVLDSLSTPAVFVLGQLVEGNKYLVGTSPTGLFVGHANNIATYDSAAAIYTFDTASIGDLLYNSTTDFVSKWTGVTWVRVGRATLHQGGDTYGTKIVMGSRDNFPTTFLVNNTLAGSIGTANPPSYNLSLGILSLPATSTGDRNTAIGSAALGLNTTGFYNTGIGYTANYHNTIGNQNTGVGWAAIGWNIGTGNTAVGYSSLNSTVSVVRNATYNTAIGWEALQNNGDHAYNIGLGVQAGALTTTLPIAPVARDSTLFVSNFTTNMYFRIDSAVGTASSIIGYNPVTGMWNHYANTGGTLQQAYDESTRAWDTFTPFINGNGRFPMEIFGTSNFSAVVIDTLNANNYSDIAVTTNSTQLATNSDNGNSLFVTSDTTARIDAAAPGDINTHFAVNPHYIKAYSGNIGNVDDSIVTFIMHVDSVASVDVNSVAYFDVTTHELKRGHLAGGGGGNTIYTADDALVSDRTIGMNGKRFSFDQGGDALIFIDPVNFNTSIIATDNTASSGLELVANGVGNNVQFNINSTDGVNTVEITGNPIANTIIHTAASHIFNGIVRISGYTVATLPAGTIGDIAYVTDALLPGFLTTVANGGSVVTPVFYDGTNWKSF